MSAIDPKQAEQEELVAEWLRATPGFFERNANLLNEIRLKHPHEDRAISLQERQMTMLRSQNQELNRRLSEMLHFGSRNDKTQQSLVAWLLRLMQANNKADIEAAVTKGLAEVFEVESAQLLSPSPAFGPWVDTPLCGSAKELTAASVDLLATQVAINPDWQSMVAIGIPLGKSTGVPQSPAVLLLASKDETRFTADMGAFYLRQIAELTAAALDRIQAYEPNAS
ncbi:MAG: hypothetical protein B7Y22_01565 [Polynucleobacter sp. 16-46-70]|jgi:uncharacterized protein YigA (DUF484 family)|nr:MAG: hypothetical protein B7Y22_01565 [Polynucleobacter sp. 16-46-70]HQS60399.1 DUF484 family protein [Polynucleobacter sp.]HQT19854.1 DUF484 family protein [Polynucleobacter sp.]HQT41396.1 DUF484 family protein [Polynucleobacter sp.]